MCESESSKVLILALVETLVIGKFVFIEAITEVTDSVVRVN